MKANTSRLQSKLTLLILLMVVPWLAASVQSGFSQRKALMRQVELDCLELLGYVESAVGMGLRRTLQAAEMVLFESGREFDIEGKQHALDMLVARAPQQLDLAIVNSEGKVLASSVEGIDFLSELAHDCLLDALDTGDMSFRACGYSYKGTAPGLLLVYPLLHEERGSAEAIVALIYEEMLVAPVLSIDFPDDISIELVDLNWNPVARHRASDKAVGLTESAGLSDFRQKLAFSLDGQLSDLSRWEDGVMRVMGIKTVTDSNGRPVFYLTLAKPGAPDMTRATVLSFYQVGVMLAIAVIVMPVGWGLMNRQFVEPIDRLVALAERLGSGHMDARHGEPYDKGEVGELAKAFDDMADALEERTAELEYLSYHDSLTGAYNRTYIEKIMDDLDSEENIPTTVIMGDINGLKTVNDTLGHEAGNKLIVTIAEILEKCVGESGIVARWSGDEFAVILPGATMRNGLLLCNRIRSECKSVGEYSVTPSIALGAATRMALEQSLMDAFVSAESRMYRNKFIDTASARGTLLFSLRKALSESTHETDEHSSRMRLFALELGKMIGLSSNTLDDLAILTSLHDIGKIGIPDSILEKAGPLTKEEWKVMRAHPKIGARIVSGSRELAHISESILAHHEKWDGSGYPKGLAGEDIPLISRILAIVDAYDAMTSDRAYRKAMPSEEALAEIKRCAGSQFDPDLAEVFLTMMEEMARSEEDEMKWLAEGMKWYEDMGEGVSDVPEIPDHNG
jgi:diguanylate cyclase (GGDEF)-like protein